MHTQDTNDMNEVCGTLLCSPCAVRRAPCAARRSPFAVRCAIARDGSVSSPFSFHISRFLPLASCFSSPASRISFVFRFNILLVAPACRLAIRASPVRRPAGCLESACGTGDRFYVSSKTVIMPSAFILIKAVFIAFHSIYFHLPRALAMFNFILSEDQIREAEIDRTTANTVIEAVQFQRSRYINDLVADDEFYHGLNKDSFAKPGSLLKVQSNVDITVYTLSSETALSRIIFQFKTINGSAVSASAYIL